MIITTPLSLLAVVRELLDAAELGQGAAARERRHDAGVQGYTTQ